MNTITICYSTHRIETLELTRRVMDDHDVIILEEPFHADFSKMLSGEMSIGDHLLELDVGYPKFTLAQYKILKQLYGEGREIIQVEPYLEHLIRIQYFFADGHGPDEITPGGVEYSVYSAEKEVTGRLLEYYNAFRGKDLDLILSVMNEFAKADAARFRLRDELRVQAIVEKLVPGNDIFVEAGSIHLGLYRLLKKAAGDGWKIKIHSIDKESIQRLGRRGSLYSPGDSLTLQYIRGHNFREEKWQLYCARALIYSVTTEKEEMDGHNGDFPHTQNDLDAIEAVKQLNSEDCKYLFPRIRPLSTSLALKEVRRFLQKKAVNGTVNAVP